MAKVRDLAWQWATLPMGSTEEPSEQYYCPTRDVFQARLDTMTNSLLAGARIPESDIYVLAAITGEIGNNSFDHNIGNWPDVSGIFFGYEQLDEAIEIILADRGVGVLATLKRVRESLASDAEALQTAFTERLSGRLPERRGNGLKFVRESVADDHFHLSFYSGNAIAQLNEKIVITEAEKPIVGCLAVLTVSTKSGINKA